MERIGLAAVGLLAGVIALNFVYAAVINSFTSALGAAF